MLNKLFVLALMAPLFVYAQDGDDEVVKDTLIVDETEATEAPETVVDEVVNESELTFWQSAKLNSPTGPLNAAVATNGDRSDECLVLQGPALNTTENLGQVPQFCSF